MKSALPWILVVVLLAGGYFLYADDKGKEAELARLGQASQELESLRAENAELKKLPAQQDELARLRKDNEDLIRLRAEVQRLRDESKQLTGQLSAAQAQTAQAQQAQQQMSQLATENQALRAEKQRQQQAQGLNQTAGPVIACINNLRQIDIAKQRWATENEKPIGAMPTAADLASYLPPGAQLACPTGGTYSINAVGTPPTCSIPGHVLR